MEKLSQNSISGPKIVFTAISEKGKSARRLSSASESHHMTSDATLFSTSLPILLNEFNLNESDQIGQPIDDDHSLSIIVHSEDEVKDPLEDVEPNTIGSFLPGDEDELLAGLMDDFDLSGLPPQVEDIDDDLFGSGGGLEIEPVSHKNLINGISRLSILDGIGRNNISNYGFANGSGTVSSEHPQGEHPSRTLFVRNINSNVDDCEVRSLFEQYGDIRKLYTACKHRGFVMISYYDIRDARNAMCALQGKPLRRRKLDIHFSIPKENPSEKDINQGTLVVFNLDASVSNDDLRRIFGAYGEVKEIRETPHKRHHKFIEYYDVRAAEEALKALNRSDIAGKRIKLELSRPGGVRRSFMQQLNQELELGEAQSFLHQVGSPIADSPPGNWDNFGSPIGHYTFHGYRQTPKMGTISPVRSNHSPGLASILPSHASNPVKIAPIGQKYCGPKPKLTPGLRPFSPYDNSKPSSLGTLSGPQFLWGSPSIHSDQISSSASSSSLKWPSGPGVGFPFSISHHSFLGLQHHVGSAPTGISLERHFGFYPHSPETSYVNQAEFGVANFGCSSGNHGLNIGSPQATRAEVAFSGNIPVSGACSSRMMSVPRNCPMYYGNGSFGVTGSDGMNDQSRGRRAEIGGPLDSNKQYQIDVEKIASGEDNRTTLMIKNIPNKYSSNMLLAAIDETHMGTYDFLYLPIDLKNKCNVGYAFINMVCPSYIITFYKAFNGKKWEKFNSEKVALLAYARIQGKGTLLSHFQNSSLMNEDKCFHPMGDPEHFSYGSNLNFFICQHDGSYAGDSLDSTEGIVGSI